MHFSLRLATSLAALLTLTACGGNGDTPLDTFQNRLEADVATGTRLFQTPGTAWGAMPTSGSATFNGSAAIIIDRNINRDADDILILGDTQLTANFGTGTMSGTIDNMTGATNMTSDSANIHDVSGQISIGGAGSIIGDDEDDNFTSRPNDWYADYYGNIGLNGNTYEVEGSLNGQFVGTRSNPSNGQSVVRGVIGVSDNGSATINGQNEVNEAAVSMELFGEN